MRKIAKNVLKEFGGIGVSVGKSFFNDLIFRKKPIKFEDQIVTRIRAQTSQIRVQETNLSITHGELRRKNIYLRNSQNLLADKDRIIRHLQERIRTLDRQIQKF